MSTIENKKTILHLSPLETQTWCFTILVNLQVLWVKEMNFRDSTSKLWARSVEVIMKDGRKTADPHLRRARELRTGDCDLTRDLLFFITNIQKMFKGESRTPFEDTAMTQDDARSWLAEKRKLLKRKIKREKQYRSSCPYPSKHAATEEETAMQQEIVLLLDELLKAYPPLRLPPQKNTNLSLV
jgi:hypothetical protein